MMSWSQWTPSRDQPWDLKRVAHLHRRAGFAPNWSTVQHSLDRGVDATVDQILNGSSDDSSSEAFESLAITIGDAAVGARSSDRLRAWWVFRMMKTPNPLIERMTLLWHNHFATSNEKVDDISAMHRQNRLLRQHCLGDFGDLLRSIVKDPAMLIWLDASANRKEHPNENLGRELMELFTLGEGNYTEDDVPEAARCLTGWTVRHTKFNAVPEYHDTGDKTVLGHTAKMDGDGLLDLLLRQQATATRLAWRLCQMFFGDNVVTDNEREDLADGLRDNGLNIRWAVDTILRSELFYSDANIRSRIASPVEYVVGTVRSLEMSTDAASHPPSTLLLAAELGKLGQDLFYPPNVFGWSQGRSWINTRSVVGRTKFASKLVAGQMHQSDLPFDAAGLANRHGWGDSASQINEFFSRLLTSQSTVSKSIDRGLEARGSDAGQLRRTIVETIASPGFQLV